MQALTFRKKLGFPYSPQISERYTTRYNDLEKQAHQITEGIKGNQLLKLTEPNSNRLETDIKPIAKRTLEKFDHVNGGFKGAPKFPMPSVWKFLLLSSDEDSSLNKSINKTLKHLANGGIYDQIGGGFARYSTDENWHIPHFEKMLYDNAQLLNLYSLAYQKTKNVKYKKVSYEIIEFVKRELMSEESSFYSSLDADSEGIEGKFYVWRSDEIDAVLKKDSPLFKDYFNVTTQGNWEHGLNHLNRTKPDEYFKTTYHLSTELLSKRISDASKKLLKYRSKRIRPSLDDKTLTSWNAIMLNSLITAYRVFGEASFLELAEKNASFLFNTMSTEDFILKRSYKKGHVKINGFADDYAFLIDACINFYQATFNEKWLIKAEGLTKTMLSNFYSDELNMFYYTSKIDNPLISRPYESEDNVIPSSNSQMCINLFYLGKLLDNEAYINISKQMISRMKTTIEQNPRYYSNWAIAYQKLSHSLNEIAFVGKKALQYRKQFDLDFHPNSVLVGSLTDSKLPLLQYKFKEGETLIYMCKDKVCSKPINSYASFKNQFKTSTYRTF